MASPDPAGRLPATRTARCRRRCQPADGLAAARRGRGAIRIVTAVAPAAGRRRRRSRRSRTAPTSGCSGALAARGIEQLYTHQAEAFAHVLGGRNVVTITPTASGKTLCYNAPVLNAILKDPSTRALYLFPTKALAQDQLAELHALSELVGARRRISRSASSPTTATRRRTRGARSAARRTSCSATPTCCTRGSCRTIRAGRSCSRTCASSSSTSCTRIAACSAATSSNILRRLQRVCRHYGSDPVFICSSATIANPRELAEGLTGKPFELVDESGAPRGEKFFLFVNPPVVNAQLGIRRSYLAETRRVALEFLKHKLQLIVFAQSRLVGRDPDDVSEGRVSRSAGRGRRRSAAIAAAICRIAAARSSAGCARARCAPSSRPTRSSSASTSARSTSR